MPLTRQQVLDSFQALRRYCEDRDFSGWDPYDGLNSRIFQATPLKHWPLARLAWIQAFKRCPINLRRSLLVPQGHNSKGIALFLTGYCNLLKVQRATGASQIGDDSELLAKINHLAKLLLSLRSGGYSGACWGYNFDWQNRVFFQPKHTPTVVATSFCADALFNAHEATGESDYIETALSACDFITTDLNRSVVAEGHLIFSYSPLDQSRVYNASLLGARLLARGYSRSSNDAWRTLALEAVDAIVARQAANGSWIYGEDAVQGWIDSFHTGFNLEAIWEVMRYTDTNRFLPAFRKGFDFYLNHFFLDDGTPKYFHDRIYPIDIHCPAQLIATLVRTGEFGANRELAERVVKWTVENMQDPAGYFYYQLKKRASCRLPYMRWAQAWMFYAFTCFFLGLPAGKP